jgi:hypothetical protein
LGPRSGPTATSCVGPMSAGPDCQGRKIRRTSFERESVVCAPDSFRLVRLTPFCDRCFKLCNKGTFAPGAQANPQLRGRPRDDHSSRAIARIPRGISLYERSGGFRRAWLTVDINLRTRGRRSTAAQSASSTGARL